VKELPDATAIEVTPPAFRMDLAREIDLVEEVIRLHGLDQIPVVSGMPIRLVRPHPRRALREELKSRLVEHGFFETMTPDFVPDGPLAEVAVLAQGGPLSVRNPVRAGESTLRRSLLPCLLQVRKHNYDRGNDGLSLFEIGTVHSLSSEGPSPIRESRLLGLLMDGDLRQLRGVVEDLLARVGLKLTVTPAEHACFEQGACASLRVGNETVATLGIVGSELAKHVGLKSRTLYAELHLDLMLSAPGRNRRFEGLPRFPQVSRDLAVILDESIPYQRLKNAILGSAPEFFVGMELFDIYRGKQVGEGKRSLALRFVFRHDERTLLGSEVDAQMAKIMAVAEKELGGSVRGT
ncbi:MAG TPA: hypothetical protein PKA37_15220, partial [Planctomycetota bacterium]|nr:hypothetical protein [Planctomycetota bacterium]